MSNAQGAVASVHPEVCAQPPEFTDDVLHLSGGLDLSLGGRLPAVDMAWRMTGPADAPVVAVLGGISAHRRVCATSADETAWWPALVGPGLGVDTDRFRVLSFDYLGGSGGSTGPVRSTETDAASGAEEVEARSTSFPSVTTSDQTALLALLLDHLGIERLHAFVGASYGGMVALAFAAEHGSRLGRLLVVSAAEEAHPLATAWRSIQRRIVRLGLQHGNGSEGLSLARALAMTTYRSPAEFAQRFASTPTVTEQGFRFPVEEYLDARGADFAAQVLPESFLCLSESIDLQHIDPRDVHVPTTLIAVRQDQLVPVEQMRALAARLGSGDRCGPDDRPHQGRSVRNRLIEIDSLFGHDAFLKEHEVLIPLFKQALEGKQS
jgi:homoserine O-acetyltransferase